MSYPEMKNKFPWVFDKVPRERFVVFGVVRDPLDWLTSMYHLHAKPRFADQPHYTGDMCFSRFLDEWCEKNRWAVVPQSSRLKNSSGSLEADVVIPLEYLNEGIRFISKKVGLSQADDLPTLNARGADLRAPLVDASMRRMIEERYAEDYSLLERAQIKARAWTI